MSVNHWKREERIMQFCYTHARQIIAELETSGGDHSEDIAELEGLIETWVYLANVAEEARLSEEHRAKAGGGGMTTRWDDKLERFVSDPRGARAQEPERGGIRQRRVVVCIDANEGEVLECPDDTEVLVIPWEKIANDPETPEDVVQLLDEAMQARDFDRAEVLVRSLEPPEDDYDEDPQIVGYPS